MENVSAAFRAGDVSAEQLFRILYGKVLPDVPNLDQPLASVHSCFRQGMMDMGEKLAQKIGR